MFSETALLATDPTAKVQDLISLTNVTMIVATFNLLQPVTTKVTFINSVVATSSTVAFTFTKILIFC